MDLSHFLPILPVRYVLSAILNSALISVCWYLISTPGPSIGFDLIFSLFLLVWLSHFLIYKLRHYNKNDRSDKQ